MPINMNELIVVGLILLLYAFNYAVTKQFGFPLLIETLVNKMFEVKK